MAKIVSRPDRDGGLILNRVNDRRGLLRTPKRLLANRRLCRRLFRSKSVLLRWRLVVMFYGRNVGREHDYRAMRVKIFSVPGSRGCPFGGMGWGGSSGGRSAGFSC